MSLRPYQSECFGAIIKSKKRCVVAAIPTGGGKSWVIADLVRHYYGLRICVVSHVRELLEQNRDKLMLHFPEAECGYWCAGLNEKRIAPVTFASIQSIYKETVEFDVIICDEVHLVPHRADGMYRTFFGRQPEARVIGLTATPYRTGAGLLHKGENALFEALVYTARTDRLIKEGWLCPVVSYRGEGEASLDGVHTRAGEFVLDEMAEVFDQAEMIERTVADMLAKTHDRKAVLVFCCTIEHCRHVSERIPGSLVVTGDTQAVERSEALAKFKAGELKYLVNCNVLTTGFDAPNIDCIVMFRATQSPGLYVQIVGRGLRKAEGKKDCQFLDYGGNVRRHGTVDSIDPTSGGYWTRKGEAKAKSCPDCKVELPLRKMKCECGHIFESQRKREISLYEVGNLSPVGDIIETLRVRRVSYRKHQKPGKPPCMKVIYECGEGLLNTIIVSDYVCFEHGGYVRQQAEKWSARHGIFPTPKTVDEGLLCEFIKPSQVTVDTSGKYARIIHEEFVSEYPERVEGTQAVGVLATRG